MKLVFRSKKVETSLLQLCTEGAVLDTPQFPYAKLVKKCFRLGEVGLLPLAGCGFR